MERTPSSMKESTSRHLSRVPFFVVRKELAMWIQINEEYLKELKKYDGRIPNQDYDKGSFKPFFLLFKLGGFYYVSQVSGAKQRHHKMYEMPDFKKINYKNGDLCSVVNLNYMFPVLPGDFEKISYGQIRERVEPRMQDRTTSYIKRLKLQEHEILNKNIRNDAAELYKGIHQGLYNDVRTRSVDFKQLEAAAVEIRLKHSIKYAEGVKVSRKNDQFLINVDDHKWSLSYDNLKQIDEFSEYVDKKIEWEKYNDFQFKL